MPSVYVSTAVPHDDSKLHDVQMNAPAGDPGHARFAGQMYGSHQPYVTALNEDAKW